MQWRKAIVIAALALMPGLASAAGRDPKSDEQALLRLENGWFYSPSLATREYIYAPDFAHIISDGQILTRQEELEYLGKHPLPPQDNSRRSFEGVKVRLYGDFGIVTGRTVIRDEKGVVIRTTSFTDVFHWRDQRWQAVNVQETTVAKP